MKRNIKNFYRDLPLPKPERVLPKEALPAKPSVLKRYRSAILGGVAAAAAVILCTVAVIRFLPSHGPGGEEYLPHLQPVESYLHQETERPSAETDPRESKRTDDADRMEDQTPADIAAATDFRLLHDKESGKFYFSFDGKMQEAGSGEVFFFMYLWTFDSERRFGSDAVLEPGVLILSREELMVQFYHPATGEVRVLARESDFPFSHSSIDGCFSPLFVKQGEQYLIIDQPIGVNRLVYEDTIAVVEPDENGLPIINTDRSTWSFLKTEPETQPETERPSAETDPRESKKTDDADRMEDQTPADVAAATDFRLLHDKESGKFYFSFDGKMQEAGSGEVFFFMYLWTFDSERRFGSDAVLEPGVLILSSEELMAQLMVQFYHPATGEVRVLARVSDFSFSHSSIDGRFSPLFVKNGEQYLIIDQPIWMNRLAFEDTIAVVEPDENGWPIVNTDRSTWTLTFLKIEPETQPETEPETKVPETKAPETKAPETKAPETKAPETTGNMDILEP